MKIENKDKNQYLELIYKYDFDWYVTYDFLGRNSKFSWWSTICFNSDLYNKFYNKLLNLNVWEDVKISDNDSDSYLRVNKLNNLWHYVIEYQLWWTHQENYCKLILNTDDWWIQAFKELLNI